MAEDSFEEASDSPERYVPYAIQSESSWGISSELKLSWDNWGYPTPDEVR